MLSDSHGISLNVHSGNLVNGMSRMRKPKEPKSVPRFNDYWDHVCVLKESSLPVILRRAKGAGDGNSFDYSSGDWVLVSHGLSTTSPGDWVLVSHGLSTTSPKYRKQTSCGREHCLSSRT